MTFTGNVEFLYIAPVEGSKPVAMDTVHAVPGRGLEGDRYFAPEGQTQAPTKQITFIEAEALDALSRDYGTPVDPGSSRRNVVTRGVPLNHLVGHEFTVGAVRLRGLELCEPCKYLADKTSAKVLPGLVHRGGLRAEILSDGLIEIGDAVVLVD